MNSATQIGPKTDDRGRGAAMCESELWMRFQIESLCNVTRIEIERLETTLKSMPADVSINPDAITREEAQRKTLKIAAEFDAAVSTWIDRWARWMNDAPVPAEIGATIGKLSDRILDTLRSLAGE